MNIGLTALCNAHLQAGRGLHTSREVITIHLNLHAGARAEFRVSSWNSAQADEGQSCWQTRPGCAVALLKVEQDTSPYEWRFIIHTRTYDLLC